jgi:hypothetical protein
VPAGSDISLQARRARGTAAGAADSRTMERLGRLGHAARGVLYAIVAVLALRVALESGGATTDQHGALAAVADEPFGKVLIGALALGLFGYAVWHVILAVRGPRGESGGKDAVKRVEGAVKALIYGGLFAYAIAILFELGKSAGGGENPDHLTARILDLPLGQWLVALAGAIVVGVGLYNAYEGLSQKFMERFRTGEMPPATRRWTSRIGTAGLLAKGIVFGLIGGFIVKAAVEYDAREAIGLGGALDKVAAESYGQWLLGAVAVGLLCYGVFCIVGARYREIDS